MGFLRSRHSLFSARLFAVVIVLLLTSCSSRTAVNPGRVPEPTAVSNADKSYGEEIFRGLREKYDIDLDDQRNTRVRTVIGKLAEAAGTKHDQWKIYLFHDDSVKNAAATRGNYVFVWTGILTAVRDDHELATVISHEMAHTLAGHTTPTAEEQLSVMLAQVSDIAARSAVTSQGYVSSAAILAGQLTSELVKALAVNPNSRRLEAEADHVGLFLMAKAGYNPEKAVEFWERVSYDPAFSGLEFGFLSSHPSSTERTEELEKHLPKALKVYNKKPDRFDEPFSSTSAHGSSSTGINRSKGEVWICQEDRRPVFSQPDLSGKATSYIKRGESVVVTSVRRRWLEIVDPVSGFVKSRDFAPEK